MIEVTPTRYELVSLYHVIVDGCCNPTDMLKVIQNVDCVVPCGVNNTVSRTLHGTRCMI